MGVGGVGGSDKGRGGGVGVRGEMVGGYRMVLRTIGIDSQPGMWVDEQLRLCSHYILHSPSLSSYIVLHF